jgi:glycosyltransferase involved in cell wall biosynthesis
MRICFLTSSLEPGRDGVGDYARDLASACISRGLDAVLIALNDPHLSAAVEETQSSRGVAVHTLRLPASRPWRVKIARARDFLQRLPPDWFSLQFVCYGFHSKGLAIGLDRPLARLIGSRPLHLMLHELWIGAHRRARLRERMVGTVQQWAVAQLIAGLKPAIVHTSNTGYANLLGKVGIAAGVLPLCGSIPLVPQVDADWLESALLEHGGAPAVAGESGAWRFGFFGTLPPAWSPEPLFAYIAEAARRARRTVAVISIGRMGPGEPLWRQMQARYGERFTFVRLGERSREDVSRFLQSIDFGLATTPWQLIGKSATTAAMLDHGVPVVVSRDDVDIGAAELAVHDELLQRMTPELPQWLLRARRQPPRDRLAAVAAQFAAAMSAPASLASQHRAGEIERIDSPQREVGEHAQPQHATHGAHR